MARKPHKQDTERFDVKIPNVFYQFLDQEAEKRKISRVDVIREAINFVRKKK